MVVGLAFLLIKVPVLTYYFKTKKGVSERLDFTKFGPKG
jgi:hypothetical protein